MSPQERLEFEQMKLTIRQLREVLDVPFIENIKRRAVVPGVTDSTTTSVLKSVSEGGASTYNVAKAYDKALILSIGNTDYKIGVYTP